MCNAAMERYRHVDHTKDVKGKDPKLTKKRRKHKKKMMKNDKRLKILIKK